MTNVQKMRKLHLLPMPKGAEKVELVEERNLIDWRNQNLRLSVKTARHRATQMLTAGRKGEEKKVKVQTKRSPIKPRRQ